MSVCVYCVRLSRNFDRQFTNIKIHLKMKMRNLEVVVAILNVVLYADRQASRKISINFTPSQPPYLLVIITI
jgi:hypothetical protein